MALQVKREIIGESAPIKEMLKLIGKVAKTKTNILIIGESGTGKELVARMIHDDSPIASEPFIPVNCGAIPETLIESELFGHKKGSFTGAHADKQGLFEAASKGTLFLDEVGELPLAMQVKLLRALQERTIRRVGGTDDIKVDIRIIAATNRDLEEAIAKGTFREDLYYRLNVIQVKTPPLRDRGKDILILVDRFFERVKEKQKKEVKGLSPDVLELFESYTWPGNVRELENVIERAVTLESAEYVQVSTLPKEFLKSAQIKAVSDKAAAALGIHDFSKGGVNLKETLKQIEAAYVVAAIAYAKSDEKAAKLLGLSLSELNARKK